MKRIFARIVLCLSALVIVSAPVKALADINLLVVGFTEENLLPSWPGWDRVDAITSSEFLALVVPNLREYAVIELSHPDSNIGSAAGKAQVLTALANGVSIYSTSIANPNISFAPGSVSAFSENCEEVGAIAAPGHPIITFPNPDITVADLAPVFCGLHGSFVGVSPDYTVIATSGTTGNPVMLASAEFGTGNIFLRSHHFHGVGNLGSVRFIDSVVNFLLLKCFVIDAIDDEFSVINDGATADLFVVANDECGDDTPISVVVQAGDLLPDRGGSATTNGVTVNYTPAAGFVGFEEFTYTAQDAGLEGGDDPPAVDQDTAAVMVNVLENLIPDAVDDGATTLQEQATIIDVLANDSLGNAPDVVTIETGPANGSATPQADDTIRYSPDFGFFGEDSFEYRLTDANGDSDIATVTVGVFFVRGQVPIDIMPNSDGNNLNLRAGQGAAIDVAILSVGEFFEAPNSIDPLTLKFGPRQANIWGSPQVRDVDRDGDDDLEVNFLIQQTGIPCGDTQANLSGRTFDAQLISGSDAINTFNCPRIRKRH